MNQPCWTYQLNTAVNLPSIHPLSTFVKEEVIIFYASVNPTKEFVGLLNNGNAVFRQIPVLALMQLLEV
jgi:hypothetical protein